MLSVEIRKEIIALINREVVPAMGCTEPIAVSLCTAKAKEILGVVPEKIDVSLSPNVLKNAMGVGIPGTNMIGLPIAVALGAIVGRSEYQLEVLRDTTPEAVEQGSRMIDEERISVGVKQGACDMLYIEVKVSGNNHDAVAIISGAHTNFVYLEKDGEVILDSRTSAEKNETSDNDLSLNLRTVWDFATTAPVDELQFILQARNLNKNAAEESLKGTNMIGLPIAVALGAIVGRSEYQLEVLRDTTPEAVEQGSRMIDEERISVGVKQGACDMLYIEVKVSGNNHDAVAIISGAHTNFVYLEKDGEVILDSRTSAEKNETSDNDLSLNLRTVWDFATTAPVDELQFILQARNLNKNAAEESLKGEWGHCLGRTLRNTSKLDIMGNSTFLHMLSYTSAACDARMGGAKIPVMSNSGSGNQGIASTLPVVVYAEETNATEEQLIRALILSHLTVIYIKQSLGRLSALCGCVVASTGSSCGITYLMGGGYEEVSMAVKNMVANLTGVICDGAKPSCALKLASGVSTAMLSAVMAMEHRCVTSLEGIIDDDVDKSIRNLTSIGSRGMQETDRMILSIMTSKR